MESEQIIEAMHRRWGAGHGGASKSDLPALQSRWAGAMREAREAGCKSPGAAARYAEEQHPGLRQQLLAAANAK